MWYPVWYPVPTLVPAPVWFQTSQSQFENVLENFIKLKNFINTTICRFENDRISKWRVLYLGYLGLLKTAVTRNFPRSLIEITSNHFAVWISERLLNIFHTQATNIFYWIFEVNQIQFSERFNKSKIFYQITAEKLIFCVKWIQSIQTSWFNQIRLWNSLTIMNQPLRIIVKKKFNIFKRQVFIVSPPTFPSTTHAKFIFRWAGRWQNWCFSRLLSITNNYAVASQPADGSESKYKNRKRLNLKIIYIIIKWGAFSRWSFRSISAWGSIGTATIRKTHPTLVFQDMITCVQYHIENLDHSFIILILWKFIYLLDYIDVGDRNILMTNLCHHYILVTIISVVIYYGEINFWVFLCVGCLRRCKNLKL